MRRTGIWDVSIALPCYDAGDGGGGGGDEKVTMTPAELDKLVASRIAAAKDGWAKSYTPPAELQAELLKKGAEEERARQELERKGQYETLLKKQDESIRKEYEPKLDSERKRADGLAKALESRVIGLALVEAAAKLNAVNPAQVRALIANDFRMSDTHEAIVVDADGNQRFVNGKPMTPEQRVAEFLSLPENANLVRSTAGDGGGAGGGSRSGEQGGVAAQLAVVTALEEEYRKTRDPKLLTKIRLESTKLTEMKRKAS